MQGRRDVGLNGYARFEVRIVAPTCGRRGPFGENVERLSLLCADHAWPLRGERPPPNLMGVKGRFHTSPGGFFCSPILMPFRKTSAYPSTAPKNKATFWSFVNPFYGNTKDVWSQATPW